MVFNGIFKFFSVHRLRCMFWTPEKAPEKVTSLYSFFTIAICCSSVKGLVVEGGGDAGGVVEGEGDSGGVMEGGR